MADEILDMFGEPVAAPRGPGRPSLEWSEKLSTKINLLFACGYSETEVAGVVGYCTKTLRKVFSKEWQARKTAKLKVRSEQLYRLNKEAEAGNVTAEKALAGMINAEQLQATSNRVAQRGAKPQEKAPPPLGKKAAAKEAAQQLGGRFATRAPPPGLLMN